MKQVFLIACAVLFIIFIVSCENAYNPMEPTNSQQASLAKQSNPDGEISLAKDGGKDKVEICHRKGNGDYVKITVAESAVQAHLNHGDMLAGLNGEWVFNMNNNPLGHYYNFDTNMGYYPYPDQGPNYTGNYTIEEISGNTISCEDGTLSFETLYVDGTTPKLFGTTLQISGDWDALEGSVFITRADGSTLTVPWIATPLP